MSRLKELWDQGVRVIHYNDGGCGRRYELRLDRLGLVHEFPLGTPEELRAFEIERLKRRIEEDTIRLDELMRQCK